MWLDKGRICTVLVQYCAVEDVHEVPSSEILDGASSVAHDRGL